MGARMQLFVKTSVWRFPQAAAVIEVFLSGAPTEQLFWKLHPSRAALSIIMISLCDFLHESTGDSKPTVCRSSSIENTRPIRTFSILTQSNPTQAGFLRYPLDVIRAFEDASILSYEPSPRGSLSAREAVSAYYSVRGHEVSPDRILLTASTSEAYAYLFKLLTDPGDSVLVPRPSYPLFEYLAAMEPLKVLQYPLRYDNGWSMYSAR